MQRRLLIITIVFGTLFVAGISWFVVSSIVTGPDEQPAGPAGLFDSDQDGLTDSQEKELGSDPMSADTDQDGLTDPQELEYGTDLLNSDSDGDGYLDGVEVLGGYDPLGKN